MTTDKEFNEPVGFIVRQVDGDRKYLHFDTKRGDYWGGRRGAFVFRSIRDAAQITPMYNDRMPYEIISVNNWV